MASEYLKWEAILPFLLVSNVRGCLGCVAAFAVSAAIIMPYIPAPSFVYREVIGLSP